MEGKTDRDIQRVIVIGSGPCGAAAADALVRRGISVVLLESGVPPPPGLLIRMGGRNLFRWHSDRTVLEGPKHVVSGDPLIRWFSNHAFGGLSNQWTGAVPRFAPEDFTEGERLDPRYRWPIGYKDLVPYYERIERRMRVTAAGTDVSQLPAGCAEFQAELSEDWKAVARTAAVHGQGLTPMPLADGPPFIIALRGTAFNSFHVMIRPLLRNPLFRMIEAAHALRIESNGATKTATAVVYRDQRRGTEERIGGAAIVVAAGPLDSTRLLFHSACSDFPHGLGNSAGVLGRYLHDHPREWWTFGLGKPIELPWPSVYLTRPAYADSPPLTAASWTVGAATQKDKVRGLLGRKVNALSVQVFGTMVPDERHFVAPDTTLKDPHGLPRLQIHLRYDEQTVCNMTRARERLMSILDEAGYAPRPPEAFPPLRPGTSVHYGGTVRMHDSPEYGMLDRWNRLHAVQNVLVVDASCFTTGAEKNPTLTAMAIAARAADRLADDLKTG